MEEAGVFETLDDLLRQLGRDTHVSVARRGLMAERYLLLHGDGAYER